MEDKTVDPWRGLVGAWVPGVMGGMAPLGGAIRGRWFTGIVTDSFTGPVEPQQFIDGYLQRRLAAYTDQAAQAALQPQQRYLQQPENNETRDQIIERHIRELQAWDRALEESEKVAKANIRACKLLRSYLTPEQLKTYNDGFIIVHGKSGSRYRLLTDRWSFNIVEINSDGGIIEKYCAYPFGVPSGDVYLTQKLWLESDDEGFKKQANPLRAATGVYPFRIETVGVEQRIGGWRRLLGLTTGIK